MDYANQSEKKLQSQRARLERWYRETVSGQRQREQIERDMRLLLDQWFGYHLVVVGADAGIEIEQLTRVRTVTRVVPAPTPLYSAQVTSRPFIVANDDELPIETESVDVVVLLNALDLAERPHQVLREAHRVLRPQGHILVVGSNRFSLKKLSSLAYRLGRWRQPLERTGPSAGVLADWLELLDFDVAAARHKLILPTGGKNRVGRWLRDVDNWLVEHNIPLGSAYVTYGIKSVRAHISRRVAEHGRARLMGLPVAKPVVGARGTSASRNNRNHLRSVD